MICPSCGSNDKKKLYPDLLDECAECGLIRADERFFTNLQAEDLYSEKYFKGAEYENYENDKQALQNNFKKRVKSIVKGRNKNSLSNVLEIGCAYGYFYETLKEKTDCKYYGMDVSKNAIQNATKTYGPHFKAGDFFSENFTEKYSDVFMWDVIEHLDKPADYLKKVHSLLNDEGKVYITTGDIGALMPKIQKEKWRMIHPPSHLFYFSKKIIKTFLENHGFDVVKIEYPSVYRSVCNIYYSLFMLGRKKKNSFHTKILNLISPKWFVPLNTFDIMFVTAVKRTK